MRLSRRTAELIFTTEVILFNQANHMAEKSINEIPREPRLLFIKANEAAQRENVDYAITLFNQVLEKEPAFFDCRKALRAAQIRKAGDKGGGFLKKMWSGAGSSPQIAKAKMALSKNPAQFRRTPDHRGRGERPGASANRCLVARNHGEEFTQGQKSGG